MENLEISGKWWVPGNDENQVTGTLKFSNNEGGRLDLMGDITGKGLFKSSAAFSLIERGLEKSEIILGLSMGGERITLYNNFQTSVGFALEAETSSFFTQYVFIGVHFEKVEDIVFDSVTVRYSKAKDWISKRIGFRTIAFSFDQDNKRIESIECNKTRTIGVRIDKGIFIQVIVGPRINISPMEKKVTTEDDVLIKIVPKSENKFVDFLRHIYAVKSFLTFALQQPISFLQIDGKVVNKNSPADKPENVGIYLPQSDYRIESERVYPLFSLSEAEATLEFCIDSWFRIIEELEAILDLYFNALVSTDMSVTNKFLNIVRALEGYHRTRNPISDSAIDQHEKRVSRILGNTPTEDQSWLGYKLKFAYEPGLYERLEALFKKIPTNLDARIIGDGQERSGFIRKIVDLRNDLIHPKSSGKEINDVLLSPSEAFRKLNRMLVFFLLQEIGFDPDRIGSMFEYKGNFDSRNW